MTFGAQTWRIRRWLPPAAAIAVQNHSDTGPMGRAPLQRLVGAATRGAVDAFLFAADEHAERWRRAGFIGRRQQTYQVMEASTRFEPTAYAAARSASGLQGAPALLWVGRLNTNKDPLTLLDAFERVVSGLPRATLTMIYGADDLLPLVRARIAASTSLSSRVHLAGGVAHDRLPAFYGAADGFVLGSHHEGSGYAVIEAIACGTTPVVTDIPSFRLLTGGGAIGALWPPGDAAACAAAILRAAPRMIPPERQRIRAHFDHRLSWGAIGRRAVDIYENLRQMRG
jgi:glycosyltransferase involved in cell wall biosynthesis